MSTYYHLRCADHDVTSGTLGNRVDNEVRMSVALWPDIVALRNKCNEIANKYKAMDDLELRTSYMIEWFEFEPFMREHGGCKLELWDEYGRQVPLLDEHGTL